LPPTPLWPAVAVCVAVPVVAPLVAFASWAAGAALPPFAVAVVPEFAVEAVPELAVAVLPEFVVAVAAGGVVVCASLVDPCEKVAAAMVGAGACGGFPGEASASAELALSQSEKEPFWASCAGAEDCSHCVEGMESAAVALTSDAELGT
jgi:hypothetical protein